jgi:hypothetical protein
MSVLLPVPGSAQLLAAAGGYVLGTGRTVPSTAAIVALVGVVIGGTALIRSRRTGTAPSAAAAVTALVTGLVGLGVGGVHALNAAGGPGTGNGLVGAVVAVVLGVVGTALGGLALARSRRAGSMTR